MSAINHHTRDVLEVAALIVVALLALVWLLTHEGCAHPIGNGVALVALVGSLTPLLAPPFGVWVARHVDLPEREDRDGR